MPLIHIQMPLTSSGKLLIGEDGARVLKCKLCCCFCLLVSVKQFRHPKCTLNSIADQSSAMAEQETSLGWCFVVASTFSGYQFWQMRFGGINWRIKEGDRTERSRTCMQTTAQ